MLAPSCAPEPRLGRVLERGLEPGHNVFDAQLPHLQQAHAAHGLHDVLWSWGPDEGLVVLAAGVLPL